MYISLYVFLNSGCTHIVLHYKNILAKKKQKKKLVKSIGRINDDDDDDVAAG